MKTSSTHPSTKELRKLLINECVVALDTNVLSALENPCEPVWLDQFSEMKNRGIRFSIPDVCIGEHINSFENVDSDCREKLAENWERMSSRLDALIWNDLPCLPLRGNLYDLVGISEKGAVQSRSNVFSIGISQRLYSFFYNYGHSQYNCPDYRQCFIDDIANERCKWRKLIQGLREERRGKSEADLFLDSLASHKEDFYSETDISELLELPVQFAVVHACNPNYNPSCITKVQKGKIKYNNDGLDYLILHLTMASINICSCDHFFDTARKMNFNRSNCCHTPASLYNDWKSGGMPKVMIDDVQ